MEVLETIVTVFCVFLISKDVGQILDLVRYKAKLWILGEKIMPNFVA